MTTTLTDLTNEKGSLEKRLVLLEILIASHPESIRSHFPSSLPKDVETLIASLSSIEKINGTTDSRKNPVEWCGWSYSFADEPDKGYWTRQGENWCSDFIDCGDDGDEHCPDLQPLPYNAYDEARTSLAGEKSDADIDTLFFQKIMKLDRHLAVAYVLWLGEGW